nr:MAG TPA: hypothetical protein [Bacteriophage sp.]
MLTFARYTIMLAFLHTLLRSQVCEQTGEEAYFIHSTLYTNAILLRAVCLVLLSRW